MRFQQESSYSSALLIVCSCLLSALEASGAPSKAPNAGFITTRAEWGARPPKAIVEMKLPVSITVIHHSATPFCNTTAECIQSIKSIQNYHIDGNGWDDIGYGFLIGGDGNIYEGRGWNRTAAHSPGYNDISIGICLIGNFMDQLPPENQLNAAKALIRFGVENNFITSDYIVYGHRDVRATECPGDQLYREISSWPEKATTLAP